MKALCIFLVFGCFISVSSAQDINGYWKGIITQDEGGYKTEYVIELWILQKGDSIIGKSYTYVDDSIYAEMDVAGTIKSGVYIYLKDVNIVEHEELQGMEWCTKTYQLLLKKLNGVLKLEGHWQGLTSFSSCIPGKVFLKRVVPRA